MDQVKEHVHENRRITICEVAKMLGISFGSVQSILKDNLNMNQISIKFIPHLLSQEQMETHFNMRQNLQGRLQRDPELLSKIVTGDVMWIYR
jgi:hypothetical protein